jgi:peptidoglycan/LPS O-acetylase OafA/YrhL
MPGVTQASVPFSATIASVLLDAARAAAALLVLISHWRNAFFVDFADVHSFRTIALVPYIIAGAGHQAVIIFFVLSGYLVGGTTLRSLRKGEWSWKRYLTHRLVRLWMVLIPALLLGLLWDTIGIRMSLSPELYAGRGSDHMTPDVASALTPKTFLGDTLFLQTISVKPLGSNGALWSLANEWWYYLLFPLAACGFGAAYKRRTSLAISLALFCGIVWFAGKDIVILFPVWLFGALLAAIPRPRFELPTLLVCGITLLYLATFFGFSLLAHSGKHIGGIQFSSPTADIFLGALTFLFLWALLSKSERAANTMLQRTVRGTAQFSYTLYVTHLPLVIFCEATFVRQSRWTLTPTHLLAALAVLAAVVGYSWSVAALTERKTNTIRGWIEKTFLPEVEKNVPPARLRN